MIALHGRSILSLIDGWGGRNCHNPFTSFHDLKANEMHQIWRKSGQEIWGKQGRICQHPSPSSKSIVQKCMKCRFSITLESTSMKCPPSPTHPPTQEICNFFSPKQLNRSLEYLLICNVSTVCIRRIFNLFEFYTGWFLMYSGIRK